MSKKQNGFLFALLILIFITFGVLYHIDPLDDAFISFRVAEHVKDGAGFVFNKGGERVEGFSNFLWVVILAFFRLSSLNIVNISIVLGMLLSVGTLTLSFSLSKKYFPKFPLILPTLIVLTDFFILNSTNGLETALFSFLFMATCYLFAEFLTASRDKQKHLILFCTSISAFLLGITRPEGPVIFTVLFFFLLPKSIKEKQFKPLCYLVVPFTILYLPYFTWRYLYFGYFFPNTFYARQLILFQEYSLQLKMGGYYLLSFLADQPHFLLLFIALPFTFRKKIEIEYKFLATVVLVYCLFIVTCGGDWNHMFGTWRFMVPLTPILLLLFIKTISSFWNSSKLTRLACFFLILLSQLSFSLKNAPAHLFFVMKHADSISQTVMKVIHTPRHLQTAFTSFFKYRGRYQLDGKCALYLKAHLPKDTLLASRQAGRLAFFSEFNFLDTDGLVCEDIAHLSKKEYFTKVHSDYLFSRNPDCFIFPIINFGDDVFLSPYLKQHHYYLAKIFCDKDVSYLLEDVFAKKYRNPSFTPPNDLPIYFLCLFEKRKNPPKIKKETYKIIFEKTWYFINKEDLIVL